MYFLTYCPRGGKIIKIIHLFVLYGFSVYQAFFPFMCLERVGYIAGENARLPLALLQSKNRAYI